ITKYQIAHRPSERQPCKMVCPEAMYQRPIPSVKKYLRIAPRTTAHRRTIPKSVPATREETLSPAPTPVTAMTMPGPAYLNRLPRVDGACVLKAPSSVTSAICPLPHARQRTHRIRHYCCVTSKEELGRSPSNPVNIRFPADNELGGLGLRL